MRTEVPNASYVSEMFIAFVRNNKVEPAQVEDVLRAIKRGLSPSLVQGHIAKGSSRENPVSNGTAMPGEICRGRNNSSHRTNPSFCVKYRQMNVEAIGSPLAAYKRTQRTALAPMPLTSGQSI